MRIVYISNVDISRPNGPGVNEREFVRTLHEESAKRGDRCHVVIPRPAGAIDFPLDRAILFETGAEEGGQRLRPILLSTKVLSLLREGENLWEKADLFILRLHVDLLLLGLIMKHSRKRYALKTLGNMYDFFRQDLNFPGRLRRRIRRGALGAIVRGSLATDLCTSQYLELYSRVVGTASLQVIENAVNVDLFRIMDRRACRKAEGLDRFGRIAGYCGGSPSLRGGAHLVEISKTLAEEYPDCGILIAGSDESLPQLQMRAANLGTADRIVFTGQVDYTRMPSLMNCLDVGIGLDAEERVRIIGNSSQKLKQYLACGVPVVCARGTNKEVCEAGLAESVAVSDREAFYGAVARQLGDPGSDSDQERMRRRSFVERHFSNGAAYEKRYQAWLRGLGREEEPEPPPGESL